MSQTTGFGLGDVLPAADLQWCLVPHAQICGVVDWLLGRNDDITAADDANLERLFARQVAAGLPDFRTIADKAVKGELTVAEARRWLAESFRALARLVDPDQPVDAAPPAS